MNIAFYSAATGMIAQQGGMNVTANNIANVNTVGYKALRPSFADCIYTEYRATEPEWDTGHGQYMNKTDFQWDIGGFTDYGQPLDYALPNDGFFMVRDYNGRDYLTRDGAFQITNVGDHWELVNASGDFVLDYEGNHITVPFKAENEENLNFTAPAGTYFMVEDHNGTAYLTRNGDFMITNTGRTWELITTDGEFVLDRDGSHITVPFDVQADAEGNEAAQVNYQQLGALVGVFNLPAGEAMGEGNANHYPVSNFAGEVTASNEVVPAPVQEENEVVTTEIDYAALTEMIGVFTVPNKWGLAQDDSNHFLVTERSGEAAPDLEADKLQYYLERSSVDLAQEMVNMIVSQRSYQLNAKIVQTADEMQQIANNLR